MKKIEEKREIKYVGCGCFLLSSKTISKIGNFVSIMWEELSSVKAILRFLINNSISLKYVKKSNVKLEGDEQFFVEN